MSESSDDAEPSRPTFTRRDAAAAIARGEAPGVIALRAALAAGAPRVSMIAEVDGAMPGPPTFRTLNERVRKR